MYTDMRDFEPEYTTEIDGLTVEIEKAGGGTVGKEYDGRWTYRISQEGVPVIFGNDLFTGTPKTHAQAAEIIYELSGLADE